MVDTTTAGVIRFAEDLMMTARTAQASANTCLKFDVASQVLVALVKERDEAVTEIARLTAERDEWKAEYKTAKKGLETYRTKNVILIRERDQALARAAEITSSATALAAAAAMDMRERAADVLDTCGDSAATEAMGQQLCCSGQMCGCQGADVGSYLQYLIRALPIDPDAQKALDKMLARAREDAIREAAEQCEKERWNTSLLMSNPPQSDAARMIGLHILTLLNDGDQP